MVKLFVFSDCFNDLILSSFIKLFDSIKPKSNSVILSITCFLGSVIISFVSIAFTSLFGTNVSVLDDIDLSQSKLVFTS